MKIPSNNCTLERLLNFYMRSPAFAKLKGRTQISYEAYLKAVSKTVVSGKMLKNYRLEEIKPSHLNNAYEQWLKVGVRTANYRKATLSAAWKYGMRNDIMVHNPVSLIKTEASQPRKVKWTRDQVKTFLNTGYTNARWRSITLIVHMAYDWGQRVGDMRVLTWDKLDLTECRLDITQSKRGADVHLPISAGLCRMLQQQKDDFGFQDYVAPRVTPRAGAYTPYDIDEIHIYINEVLAEANLPSHLTAMDLRRTAVTEMMEKGVDLVGIMQVTGHKSANSVRPYMVNTFSGASKALAARGNDDDEYS